MTSTATSLQVIQTVSSVLGPKPPLPQLTTDISTSQETTQAMDILHNIPEEAFLPKIPQQTTRVSATVSKPPSDKQDVIDLAEAEEDNINNDEDYKQLKFDQSQGKLIRLAKRNLARFYCEICPRSYS